MLVSKRFLACAIALLPLAAYATDDEAGCKRMVDIYLETELSVPPSAMTNETNRRAEYIKAWRKNGESECAIQRRLMSTAAQLENAPGNSSNTSVKQQ